MKKRIIYLLFQKRLFQKGTIVMNNQNERGPEDFIETDDLQDLHEDIRHLDEWAATQPPTPYEDQNSGDKQESRKAFLKEVPTNAAPTNEYWTKLKWRTDGPKNPFYLEAKYTFPSTSKELACAQAEAIAQDILEKQDWSKTQFLSVEARKVEK